MGVAAHLSDRLATRDSWRRFPTFSFVVKPQKRKRKMAEAPNPAVTSFPSPTISLPLGLAVLRTYSGALICMEIVFGGLVWILVASSHVPVPLLQGWVMFVSVTMFVCSSAYLVLFLLGLSDRINTDWNFMDVMYHFTALVFYFAAFVLEAAVTSAYVKQANDTCVHRPSTNIITFLDSQQYRINIVATICAFIVTICYACSMFMGFRRWRK
ncbi:protein MAL2 [Electrophorus electricus]|uniref:MARVEL domain-containing protein n=1 Tax=Electrophorus electricus TaxID=8005 RepID=A0A4W4DS20_ELEEL|nr:protein MAL2 [Electrophorus electricus]